MGPNPTADKKHLLFYKKFFYREGQDKAFYHNVRILYRAKQETLKNEKRCWKDESVQNII